MSGIDWGEVHEISHVIKSVGLLLKKITVYEQRQSAAEGSTTA